MNDFDTTVSHFWEYSVQVILGDWGRVNKVVRFSRFKGRLATRVARNGNHLSDERRQILGALVDCVCADHGISKETVNSIMESHFGVGGISGLCGQDYERATRYLKGLSKRSA